MRLFPAAVLLALATACSGSSSSPRAASTTAPPSEDPKPAVTSTPPVPTQSRAASEPAGGPVPAGFYPVAYSFVSATTGFVLGTTPTCAKSPCTSMLRTHDAGRTWTGIPAPLVSTTPANDSQPSVEGLAFADPKNGFAWGNGLYATHNGGASWHKLGVTGEISNLVAGGDRVYAVVGSDTATLVAGAASGDSFAPVQGVKVQQDARITAHGSAVWVTSQRSDDTGPPLFYASADGRTFVGRSTPCTKGFSSEFGIAASGDRNLVGVCGSEPATAMQHKQAFVSSDSGRHWTRVGDPPGISGTELVATGKGTFLTDSRLGVEVTRNGGRTWPYVFKDDGGGAHDAGFVNDDLGFLIDQQKLYVSRNAGATWTPVSF